MRGRPRFVLLVMSSHARQSLQRMRADLSKLEERKEASEKEAAVRTLPGTLCTI